MPGPPKVHAVRRDALPGKVRELPGGDRALVLLDPWTPRGAFAVGEFAFGERRFTFACPCGCMVVHNVKIQGPSDPPPDPSLGPCWAWDGNLEAPTLRPSLATVTPCRWHGFLTSGVFESV
jgi:hypothetical protein